MGCLADLLQVEETVQSIKCVRAGLTAAATRSHISRHCRCQQLLRQRITRKRAHCPAGLQQQVERVPQEGGSAAEAVEGDAQALHQHRHCQHAAYDTALGHQSAQHKGARRAW